MSVLVLTHALCAQGVGTSGDIKGTVIDSSGVAVAIGRTVTIDFRLKVSQVATVIEVTDEPPVVDIQRASQADTVPERYIDDLPIGRRDYLTFTC